MVIGFTGYKGSGKNEAANALIPLGYRICAFADALKAEVTTRLRRTCIEIAKLHYRDDIVRDTDDNILIAMLLQEKPPAMRRLLQEYGTEVRRADNDLYWLRQLKTRVALTPYRERNFAITDVRFANEVKMVHQFEGKVIRVLRSLGNYYPDPDDHTSEKPNDLAYDITITNDGTLAKLHDEVIYWLSIWTAESARKR